MNDSRDKNLRRWEDSLAFFGAITASTTHELNNIIGIIDQSAGLLEDLLVGARNGKPIAEDKLERVSDITRAQAARGIDIIKRLNTFAHTADRPILEYNLGAQTENLAAILKRLVGLKKATLELRQSERAVILPGRPFLMQQAIFLIVKRLLTGVQAGDVVDMTVEATESGGLIRVEGPKPDPGSPIDLPLLEDLIAAQGGALAITENETRMTYEMSIAPTAECDGADPGEG